MSAPALDDADVYVAAAYLVFVTLVAIYVVIITSKLRRTLSRLEELAGRARKDGHS
jgi:hypothetical protein